jgi:hypothetical protein
MDIVVDEQPGASQWYFPGTSKVQKISFEYIRGPSLLSKHFHPGYKETMSGKIKALKGH